MIDKTVYCTGEQDTKYTLNGIKIDVKGDDKEIALIGTDGHRLAYISSSIETDYTEDIEIVIPKKSILEIRKFLSGIDEDILFDKTHNHIRFYIQDKEILSKLLEGKFPDYDKVIPKLNDKKMILDR
ncbi:DNA polymerase III subunit beta, partial [Candidatus Magnetoovum chiemensis]